MIVRVSSRALLLTTLLACACGHGSPPPRAPSGASGATQTAISARLDAATIRTNVQELSTRLSISATQRVELREKLDALLASPDFAAVLAHTGVQAVGVYRYGEGGLVVKIARGDGTIRFAGIEADRSFELESTSIGAQVGGSASWGVVLASGLPAVEQIDGTYRGAVASATAIEQSTGALRMTHRSAGHTLYFVGVAAGLSANAGENKLVFALR